MPEEFLFGDSFLCWLVARKGAYTSRCQMPDFFRIRARMEMIILVMVYILVTIQNHLGPEIDIEKWV